MKRILISLIFLMLLPKAVLATAQAPDHLIYEGETHALFSIVFPINMALWFLPG